MKKQKKNGGFTLVELIVSFALTGLLLASASVVLANYGIVTADMTAISQAEVTAVNIMDAIDAELAYAGNSTDWYSYVEDADVSALAGDPHFESCVVISKDNKTVYFSNKIGTLIKIFKKSDGTLSITYGSGTSAVDWGFGQEVYMGNTLKELTFSKLSETSTSRVIKVHMELENQKTGYKAKKETYIECFQIPENGIYQIS